MAMMFKLKRAAKAVATNVLLGPPPPKEAVDKVKQVTGEQKEKLERMEYERLKKKFEPKSDEQMRAEWEVYYREQCEGECEKCPYYDWCPDDPEELSAMFPEEPAEAKAVEEDEPKVEEPEVELTEEQRAAKEAAEAYYADGCDGACETCEHYDWCPAEEEEEENPDDKEIFKGITQGDVKRTAKGSVQLARETAATVRDLKEAMDDIMGGFNINSLK